MSTIICDVIHNLYVHKYYQSMKTKIFEFHILDRVQTWILSGSKRFKLLDTNICFIICDITNMQSIIDIDTWFNIAKTKFNATCQFFLIINKMDLFYDNEKMYVENINFIESSIEHYNDIFNSIFKISSTDYTLYNIDDTKSLLEDVFMQITYNIQSDV